MSKDGAVRSLIRLVARIGYGSAGLQVLYSLDQALSALRRARACTPHGIQNRPRELEELRSDGDGLLCLLYVHRMGSTPPCTCTSRTPLRAVTATRLDASVYSTSAASVYSCFNVTDRRETRTVSFLARPSMSTVACCAILCHGRRREALAGR